jgi:D-alanyl-D-alanine carboxypeptidase/D-alanyl-D-alanine-endopeptidase (penicillin-binding protein 4)
LSHSPVHRQNTALRILAVVAVAALSSGASQAAGSARHRSTPSHRAAPPPALVWHIETMDGRVLDSRDADLPINPASVTKVATTWWALERLGPDHRFTTRFCARGTVDRATGILKGDLVVRGDSDPDFQADNAFLVAAALNGMGIRKVTGSVVVDGTFWMGWENGSEGTIRDADRRAETMAARLRAVLDVRRWSRATRSDFWEYATRRGLSTRVVPSVQIFGGSRYEASPAEGPVLFEHVSKPLVETLRRFNCFSNNDIERVGASLGPASELSVLLADRLVAGATPVRLETTSGLGENRLSPRQIVAMMRAFRTAAEGLGLGVEHLLPVAGCDPGTVTSAFPRLSSEPYATSLVAKTGTLTSTDGGITVLAGFLNTGQGEVVFCLAAPHAAGRIRQARRTEEGFLLSLLSRMGGSQPRTCAPPLGSPDAGASIVGTSLASTGDAATSTR